MPTGESISFAEFVNKYCGQPFKLNKPQRDFMVMIQKYPDRKLVMATRGQLKRMRL